MKVALLSDTWCKNADNNHVDCDWAFEQCPSGCEPKYIREKCTLNDGSKRGFIMFGCNKGGFQLLDLIITGLKSHITC